MSTSQEAAGMAVLCRILAQLSAGEPMSVSDLIKAEDLPRSTTFDVVKRMEERGFVARVPDGRLALGLRAGAFGYAYYGLGRLFNTAQAMLPWLRDETGATVALDANDGVHFVTIGLWAAPWYRSDMPGHRLTTIPIYRSHGNQPARLRLLQEARTEEGGVAEASRLAQGIARRLAEALVAETAS